MRIKYILFTFLAILTFVTNVNGQSNNEIRKLNFQIQGMLSNKMSSEIIKDSTAFYATTIIINVSTRKNEQNVSITYDDFKIDYAFEKFDFLKKLDYSKLMNGQKSANFVYRVLVLVSDSTYNPPLIDIESVFRNTINLFVKEEYKSQFIGSFIVKLDKKIYK